MPSLPRQRSVTIDRRSALLSAARGALVLLQLTASVSAQLHLEASLPSPPPAFLDNFGSDVDLEGDTLVVGASGVDPQGAVHLFTRQGIDWIPTGVLVHPQPTPAHDLFGRVVDLDGDTLAVASNQVVSLFRLQAGLWVLEADLPVEVDTSWGASSLSLSGDTVALSTYDPGQDHVLVFARGAGGWSLEQDITPTPTSSTPFIFDGDTTLSLDGETLVIGRHESYSGQGQSGSYQWVEVWDRAGGAWSLTQTIQDNVGTMLVLRGERLLATGTSYFQVFGFPPDVTPYNIVYDRAGGGSFVQTKSFQLGTSSVRQVALGDDELAFLWSDDGSSVIQMAHFVSQGSPWVQTGSVSLDSSHPFINSCVAMDTGHVVAGFPNSTVFGTTTGAAMVLRTSPWGLIEQGALAGTGGVKPVLFGSGPLTPGSNNYLRLSKALPGSFCHLVVGLGLLMHSPFKGGVFVPTPDVLILGQPVDAAGNYDATITWWPAGVVPVGTPLYVQFWVTDPGAPVGFSASLGLELIGQ